MKVKVYRSLDKPNSFFTIKGRFMYIMIAGLLVSIVLAVIAGIYGGKVIGFIVLGIGAVASYVLTLSQQGKRSDREFFRMLSSRKIRGYIKVRPVRMTGLFENLDSKKQKK